jgi:hypothetical protein
VALPPDSISRGSLCPRAVPRFSICPETCDACDGQGILGSAPTVSPSFGGLRCDDSKFDMFFVGEIDENQRCVSLAARPEWQELQVLCCVGAPVPQRRAKFVLRLVVRVSTTVWIANLNSMLKASVGTVFGYRCAPSYILSCVKEKMSDVPVRKHATNAT